jgi:hypothetical protein
MSDARWDRRRYAFALPAAQIAQRPADRRDGSRLLVCDRDGLSHQRFADLPAQLRAGDLVVANDTRVVPSRLTGRRDTGAAVEILTVTPLAAPAAPPLPPADDPATPPVDDPAAPPLPVTLPPAPGFVPPNDPPMALLPAEEPADPPEELPPSPAVPPVIASPCPRLRS